MTISNWTLLSIIFYLAVLIALLVYVYGVRRASWFEPVSMFLFFLTLFALPLPIRLYMTTDTVGDVSPMLLQFAPWMPGALALTTLAMATFVAAYYSRWAVRLGNRIPLPVDRGGQGSLAGVIVLVGLASTLLYLLTEPLGGFVPFLLLGYKSSEETFGMGYLAVGFPWLVVAALVMLDRFSITKMKIDLLISAILMLADVVIFIMTGNRSMIIYIGMAAITIFHLRVRRISFASFVLIIFAGFISLNVIGLLRGSNYNSVKDFTEKTISSTDSVGSDSSDGIFYTLTVGEFVVPFETFPQMMRIVGSEEKPWLGLSFLRAPVYFIPSVLYPDRPLPLTNWYMKTFYGEGYGLNEGRAFFFLSEGYLNFGFPGVFLLAAFWGVAWGALQRWMVRGRERFGTVLIYALLTAFIFRCIAGDFASLLVGTIEQSLSAVFIVLIVARFASGGRSRRRQAR